MIPPEHDDDDPDTTTRPRNTDKPVREAEWTIIEKPSHEWEKIEVPRPEVIDTDEELRRLVGKDSIWAFVRSWVEVATGLKGRNGGGGSKIVE